MGDKVGENRRRCAPPFSCYPRKTAGGGGVQTPPSRAKVNPRLDGVWRVTRPDGGWPIGPPLRIFKSKRLRVKIQTASLRSRRTLQDTIMLTLFFDL